MDKKKYIAEKILPVLFDALPKLLRAVEKNNNELNGVKTHWRFDKEKVSPIKPNQWLAQYLLRHNPNHADCKLSDELYEDILSCGDEDNKSVHNSSNAEDVKGEQKKGCNNDVEKTIVVGQRVRARFAGKGHLYNGTITADNGDGTFSIDYDDGDWEDSLEKEFIQPITVSN